MEMCFSRYIGRLFQEIWSFISGKNKAHFMKYDRRIFYLALAY